MAQEWYIGAGGKARKITKAYIGVNNIAREIISGFIGVANKARKFWNGSYGPLAFKGLASKPRHKYESNVPMDKYVVFAGYSGGSNEIAEADAYDANLVRSNCSNSNGRPRGRMGAGRAGGYALFGGGENPRSDSVEVYRGDNLVHSTTTLSQTVEPYGTSVGSDAVIGFGFLGSHEASYVVDFFSSALVRSSLTLSSISHDIVNRGAISTGTYAIFAGGREPNGNSDWLNKNLIDIFDQNHTHIQKNLSVTRYSPGMALLNKTDVIIAGGSRVSGDSMAEVTRLDANLVQSNLTPLSRGRAPAGAYTRDYALFFGSTNVINSAMNAAFEYYDQNFVHTDNPIDSSIIHLALSGASFKDRYAMFLYETLDGSYDYEMRIYSQ